MSTLKSLGQQALIAAIVPVLLGMWAVGYLRFRLLGGGYRR